jgi:hypothetical protein
MIAQLGARLAALPTPYTLLYQQVDACRAMQTVMSPTGSISGFGDPAFYTAAPTAKNPDAYREDTCAINKGIQIIADVALSDVYYTSCPRHLYPADAYVPRDARMDPAGSLATVADFLGPTQAMVFVVAQSNFSSQYLLLEETQNILACGTGGRIFPFVDKSQLYLYQVDQNAGNSFTNGVPLMTYTCLNLPTRYYPGPQAANLIPPTASEGRPEGEIVTSMLASINPSAALGLISVENYDEHRGELRSLAVLGPGQDAGKKAYWPDSDVTSRDRRNVRDGHYVIQGPLHMIARVGQNDNVPTRPMARRFLNWMQGKPGLPGEEPLPFNMIDVFAKAGVVPDCAMKVVRTTECGPFNPYKDPAPCGCYFESKATGVAVPPGCVPCTSSSECGGRVCSYGFCE